MEVLVIKLGATGDVVRTTPLLRRFESRITWITAPKNTALLKGITDGLRCLSWDEHELARDRRYDLVVNLEDELETALFARTLEYGQLFGAFVEAGERLKYTDDSRGWFDLSLISRYGRKEADRLKLLNRRAYQELVFDGLGFVFQGERYLLPQPIETELRGDVAIAADSGPVWPNKKWAFYGQLKERLEAEGLVVNVLGVRSSLLEHLSDVKNHRCLVGGDSLPMHLALGTGTRCVSLFTCTSPWEIYGYGIQTKLVSPLLEECFYRRSFDPRATAAISLDDVCAAVLEQISSAGEGKPQLATGLRRDGASAVLDASGVSGEQPVGI